MKYVIIPLSFALSSSSFTIIVTHLLPYFSVISHLQLLRSDDEEILVLRCLGRRHFCTILAPAQVWKNMHVARMSSSRAISAPMPPRKPAAQSKKAPFIALMGRSQQSGFKA